MTTEQPAFFERDTFPAPLPLGSRENRNLEKICPNKTGFQSKSVDLSDPEIRAMATAARKRATPKRIYGEAVQRKCEECTGINPAVTDCGGKELNDGTACRLYHVNTRDKRHKVTKTGLKKAIRQECHFCIGAGNSLADCSSPSCALYSAGAGPHVERREGRE